MTKRHLIITKVNAKNFKFVKYPDGTQSYQQFWFDLHGLNDQIFCNKYKICLPQKPPHDSPSTCLYVIHLADAINKETLVNEELPAVNEFVLNLSASLGVVLLLDHFEIIFYELPSDKDIGQSISDIGLQFRNGNFKAILWLHPSQMTSTDIPDQFIITASDFNTSFIGKIENPSILSEWFTFFSPNPNSNNYNATRISKSTMTETIQTFSYKLKQNENLLVLYQLFNEAKSIPDLRISYLLLWQILEYMAQSIDEDKLIKEIDLSFISEELIKRGYDEGVVQDRVKNSLKAIGTKSFSDKLKQSVTDCFPDFELSAFPNNKLLGHFRKIRAKIAHPLESRTIFPQDVIDTYHNLRELISDLFKSL